MPATHSFVFGNNKGGSGKTFLLFQLACEAARSKPDRKVLVIDFSLYSDTSGLLMGGMAREHPLAPTKGLQNTVDKTTPETRAEGLVRALVAAGETRAKSVFGAWFSAPATKDVVDLSRYWIQPSCVNPRIPSNLFLVASATDASWGTQHTGNAGGDNMDVDVPIWARQHSTDWWPAAQQLKKAVAALSGEWVVFTDTDHLASSPLTKLALGAMDRTIVPLSLDEGDFSRLFHDPTGNALFKHVMMPMARDNMLSAPVSHFLFTKMTSNKNEPVETTDGIRSPFTPAAAVQAQMGRVAESLFDAAGRDQLLQASLREYDSTAATLRAFGLKYFSVFKTVSDVSLDISKHHGAPLCTMDCTDSSLGDVKSAQSTVQALRVELTYLLCLILYGNPNEA